MVNNISIFVSVIIPVYNYARFIGRALDSVLSQTYGNYEILVIDDGSTDNLANVLKDYNSNIRYFYKENGGVSSARNFGIKKANGKLIAFLDADDEWTVDKLEKQVKFLSINNNYRMCYTDMSHVCNNAFVNRSYLHERKYKYFSSGDLYLNLLEEGFIFVPTVMLYRDCFDQVGYFDESLTHSEDRDMWLRVAKKFQIGFIDEPLTIRHDHGGGATSVRDKYHLGQIQMYSKVIDGCTNRAVCRVAIEHRSRAYWNLGYVFFSSYNMMLCRKNMINAIRDGFSARICFFYILVSFFPVSVVEFLRKLKSNLLREDDDKMSSR